MFFAAHYDELRSISIAIFHNRADGEDGLHDVFKKLLKSTAAFPATEEELMQYICRAINNRFLDVIKHRKRSHVKCRETMETEMQAITLPGNAVKMELVNTYMKEHPLFRRISNII